MKRIRLHGELKKRFGEFHELEVSSAAEAVRALSVNYPGFDDFLFTAESREVRYHVLVDQETVSEDQLRDPASASIEFIPVVRGAGGSTEKLIIGASLVVAGVALQFVPGAQGAGVFLIKVGAALSVSGVVQALTPIPKAPEPAEKPDNKPSYTFNGPVNTTRQGQPVPIGYGRLIIGSAVVSASISVDDTSPPPPDPLKSLIGTGTLSI